ncbi:TetR/AcrR family transcriptional regulator [Flavobacterium sp.]|uniref:TetR/AcrR family transcriptional regulator n=1 Tax=Flavobacterium sp. TaxID=239 RepID=UPI004048368A
MNNKEKILLSALTLFAKNGYTETSIDKIAKHAGVSKGLTYTHFKNKEELLVVTIENTIAKMTSEMMMIQELNFNAFFNLFFASLQNNTEIIRLCLLLVIHPQTPSKVINILDSQKNELLNLFSTLLENKFRENSQREAEILLATLDGITIEYVTNPNPLNLKTKQQYLSNKYTL